LGFLVIKLKKTLDAFGASIFKDVMKDEVERLDIQLLPLQAGLSQGSYVSENKFTTMILGVSEKTGVILANASIFYTSIIAGCNCADDPSPIEEQTEYCEVQFKINKKTAAATVKLLV
jgi:hypothetical protein